MERDCRLTVVGIWIFLVLPLLVGEAAAQIRISKSNLTIDEGGEGSYKVHLDARPSAETTLDITTTNSDVGVKPASLTFTPDDWDRARTVTIEAIRDADAEDDRATVSHSLRAPSVRQGGDSEPECGHCHNHFKTLRDGSGPICPQPRNQYHSLLRPLHPKGGAEQLQRVLDRGTKRLGDCLGLEQPKRRQSVSFLADVLCRNLEQ